MIQRSRKLKNQPLMNKYLAFLLLGALSFVALDRLTAAYMNLHELRTVQNQMLGAAINQGKIIAEQAYVTQLNDTFYKQGQIDHHILVRFGEHEHNLVKKTQNTYLQKCIPLLGDLECHKKWITTSLEHLDKLIGSQYKQDNLTSVSA